jgi:O-antigen/teichoic acid export membrane protein
LSTIKKFAGQTAIYGVSTIVSRMLYFILTPLLTRKLSTGVYGIFTNMYSYASLINAVLSFGMETTFFRYLSKKEGDKDKVYSNSFIAVAVMASLFVLFTLLFSGPISHWMQNGKSYNPDYTQYVRCFIYILAADAIAVIPFAKVRADGRPFRYALIKFANIITVVSLTLLLLYVVPFVIHHHLAGAGWFSAWYRTNWVGYVFYANLAASLLTLLMLLPEMTQLKPRFDKAIFYEMLIYSWPILVANISFIINENLDKIMLNKLLPPGISEQEVGIYGGCAKIALFLSIFVQAFRLGAEPFFFSHAKNKNAGETYARIMNYFVIVVTLIFVALVANIEVLKYFIGKSYWQGLGVVPLLLFGYVSLGIYMNLSVWYKLSDQTKYGLYISGVGAILTIILNWVFIPKYSYMTSAWVSLIAYATMMILSYLWGQKNYPIPYNIKKNLGYIIASLVLVFLSFYVFHRNIYIGNALLLIFTLVTVYIERKELAAMLKLK